MGHSGGTWATQCMYLGPSGDVFGPLRGCIWATQGMYLGNSGEIYGPLRRVNGIVNGIVRDIYIYICSCFVT